MTETLDISILGPALAAGLLVLSTHVPLGQQVLARGIIFLDLAVAQIAGLGVIVAHSFGWDPGGWQVQLIAMSAALAGALLLYLTEKYLPDIQEAIIGCAFVLAACGGLLALSTNPHGGEQLKELLSGQILWVSYGQLIPVALIYAAILGAWFALRKQRHPLLFYAFFALAVTTSVQLVGVYLVFASLIMPALAARGARRSRLVIAYGCGALGYALGLALSAICDLPSGATVVCLLAVCAIATAVLLNLKQGVWRTVPA